MRAQLVSLVVVVLVAAVAVSARHVPHPKAHHAVAHHAHHHMYSPREAAEYYLGKDFEAANDYLLAFDCGSSGTKVMVYAKATATCPTVACRCKDDLYKINMGLSGLTNANAASYFQLWTAPDGIAASFPQADFAGFIAKATAGNRIISVNTNTTSWANFNQFVKVGGTVNLGAVPAWNPETMPGTMEAWLEYKAAVKLAAVPAGNPAGNFFSLGGASAQAAFVLPTQALADRFQALFQAQNLAELSCNNQNQLNHYGCVVKAASNVYKCLTTAEVAAGCGTPGECVGLVSWLAGKANNAVTTGCSTKNNHHKAGGTNEVRELFTCWIGGAGDAHATACHAGSSRAGCVNAVRSWINNDKLVIATRTFVGELLTAVPGTKWWAAGNMKASLFGMDNCKDPSGNIIPGKEGGCFFHSNGMALVSECGAAAHMIEPGPKIDWLDSAADILQFTQKCALPAATGLHTRKDGQNECVYTPQ